MNDDELKNDDEVEEGADLPPAITDDEEEDVDADLKDPLLDLADPLREDDTIPMSVLEAEEEDDDEVDFDGDEN